MRVCFISGTYPDIKCGVGFHTFYLAEALANSGLEVGVLTTNHQDIADTLRGKPKPRVMPVISKWNWRSFSVIHKTLKDFNPDVIHFQHPTAIRGKFAINLIFFFLRLWFPEKRIFLTMHELTEASVLGRLRNLFLILTSPRTIFPNPNDYQFAKKIFPFLARKFFQVPIGPTLPLPALDEVREIPLNKNFRVAFNGFLDPKKGAEDLLSGAAKIASKFPEMKIDFLTAVNPSDNPYHKKLAEFAEELGLKERIIWHPKITSEEIVEGLLKSHLAVLPFKNGATLRRSTLLEALSAGLPVVTTHTELTPPEFRDEVNMLLVPARDGDAIARAAEKVFTNPDLGESLRKEALHLAQEFSWEKIAARTKDLYTKREKENQGS